MANVTSIPVVDIGGLRSGDESDVHRIARQIHDAFAHAGFMYITNHGIGPDVIDAAIEAARDFFHLPAHDKHRYATNENNRGWNGLGRAHMDGAALPDDKEFFQIGLDLPASDPEVVAGRPLRGPNVWPDRPREFKAAMSRYFDAVGRVGADVLRAVAVGLGVPADFFAERYTRPLQRTQVIYYPARPPKTDPDHYGVAPHSDYGCMTLLYQDRTGGLHVMDPSGRWIEAPPIEGSLVVNIGDLLERWSNHRFVSTKHMVRNRGTRERMSIATFYDPDYCALVDPNDLEPGHPPETAFTPILAGDYIVGRIRRSIATGAY